MIHFQVDEEEIQKAYNEFYDDVFPEWSKFGKIVQFKVMKSEHISQDLQCCNNLQSHLRGNVYIQYETVESAILARVNLDGRQQSLYQFSLNGTDRFYGGHPLRVNFSLIKDWKQAICAYNGPEMAS